jgi:2-methylcitrate dehydratase PrpD
MTGGERSPGPVSAPAGGAGHSAALARFVASHRLADLPAGCVALARRGILDALGCGLYGATLRHAGWVRELATEHPGPPEAVGWGSRHRLRAEEAARVNGTAVHATEMSETFIRAVVHPGNVIVPAAVAVAEQRDRSGAELLAAVTLAYEVLVRCGLAAGTGALMAQRLHTFSLLGGFGAAAAAAKLHFGDDERAIADTLGIAASLAPTTLFDAARTGATVKDLYEGQAAAVGAAAARYAARGVTGLRHWAEEWFPAVIRSPDLPRLTDGLGTRWEMDTGGLRIKLLPVMGLVQPTVAAVRELLARREVPTDRISRVRVDSTRRAVIAVEPEPDSVTGAKASIPFTVAALLVHRAAADRDPYLLDFFTEDLLRDRQVRRIARTCRVYVDDRFEHHFESADEMRYESRVTITLDDGEEIQGYADIWPATSRLSFDDIVGKFTACARRSLPEGRVGEVVEAVRGLESLPRARSLTRLLSTGGDG